MHQHVVAHVLFSFIQTIHRSSAVNAAAPHTLMLATFTSAEGAHVVDVLTTRAALSLLLEGLFLENVGLSLPRLLTNTQTFFFLLILEPLYRIKCGETACGAGSSRKQCKNLLTSSKSLIWQMLNGVSRWPKNKSNKETGFPQLFPHEKRF